ncbi:MAG TPA: hydroxymethylbilane synthase [Candidatus Dormibacteraeota bacterium]|nr:hydroxymethylbilane synthase [Candidatus Dormibacteraeota bacterium]
MTATTTLRLGTRGSRLAIAQAQLAVGALRQMLGIDSLEVVEIRTTGDAISDRRPAGTLVVGDGQFTGELEQALLENRIDIAVHSLKDLPTASSVGLRLGAILERGDPRDCLLSRHPGGFDGLPLGAEIGTSSVRRAAQLAAARVDLVARPIRGNVDTRLRRLEAGEYDALLLAAAGLDRLGIPPREDDRLSLDLMLPAPGQGALALQVRAGDAMLLAALDHAPTRIAVEAERALLLALGGGCLAPLGALGEVRHGKLRLRAAYEGSGGFARVDVTGPADRSAEVVAETTARIMEATA